MTRVLVVGGGVAGLAAARRLAGFGDVTVLEAGSRFGGKLATVTLDGVDLDAGAESVLARRPEALQLIGELGLADRTVHPTGAQPALLVGGRRRALPPSLQGIPTDPPALADLLSPDGFRRARAEPDRPAPPLAGDVAVGQLVDERFGPEVTDRLLEPLLGGVYAGRSRELSLAAVAPLLFAAAQAGGPLSGHARAALRPGAGPVFAGLSGGVAGLVPALITDLRRAGVELSTGTVVRAVSRSSAGYALACDGALGARTYTADAVVLAAPAAPTGRLLSGLVEAAAEWTAIPYASVAVLTTVVRGLDPEGSGLLVPPGELPSIKAMTHSSVKWDWVADRARSAWGDGTAVVRFSVGRRGEEGLLQLPDDALLARTLAEARAWLPGWDRAELVAGAVTRWGGGLPQYLVGHRELVARLRAGVAALPGLAVCGAALDGVGVAACLATAELAAAEVRRDLG